MKIWPGCNVNISQSCRKACIQYIILSYDGDDDDGDDDDKDDDDDDDYNKKDDDNKDDAEIMIIGSLSKPWQQQQLERRLKQKVKWAVQ